MAAERSSGVSEQPPAWHALDASAALSHLGSATDGLSEQVAAARRAEYGPNALERRRQDGPLQLIWRQINSPLVWVLLASGALAIFLGKALDGSVVLGVVILNTVIGFVQEYRAGRAIEALVRMVPDQTTVLRDGQRRTIPAVELAPGDVVVLQSGDKVPADLRLLQVKNLQIEEAALTGESVPVQKQVEPVSPSAAIGDRTCLAYSGTLVASGTGAGVVIATGQRTELGRISNLLESAEQLQTPLTRALATIAAYITVGILAVTGLMFVAGLLRMTLSAGEPLGDAAIDMSIFAIALAVGAIPEGLPAIVTIALAIGVQRMAARRAVVRKLPSVETLGSTTVICTDKTGTLTRNEMTVRALWTPEGHFEVTGVGYEPRGELRRDGGSVSALPGAVAALMQAGALCNDAALHEAGGHWTITGDPTEGALVVAAEKLGLPVADVRARCQRIDALPFESEHQYMATLHRDGGADHLLVVKGAPEVILRRCRAAVGGQALDRERVLAEVERLAGEGLRVLAFAQRRRPADAGPLDHADVADGLEFVGLQGMIDPPRPEAIAAVRACHQAGITVKMITGDHKGTAVAIGRQLGLTSDGVAVTGEQLARCSDDELVSLAVESNVFARVAPEHKLRLVRALQKRQHVVAMTGDGVNDAPALRQANVGVAMGITGTAVSKEAADIVLTDDNFVSIAAAVEEGRRVYDNLIKSLAFVLPTNLGLALILVVAVLFFPFDSEGELLLPMEPTQLLWINLVATVALALPLAFEAKEPDVMRRPPRRPGEPVLSRFVVHRTVLFAVLMCAGATGLFVFEYFAEAKRLGTLGGNLRESVALTALHEAQTMAVTAVIMFQIFYMLNCRSLRDSLLRIGLNSNPTVWIGIGVLLVLQLVFIYAPPLNWLFETRPLSLSALLLCVLVGAVVMPIVGLEKWLRARRSTGKRAAQLAA